MHLTTATQNDVPELLSLVNSAYRGDTARKGWAHEADLLEGDSRIDEDSLRMMIASPTSVILTMRDEDRMTGCVHLDNHEGSLYLGMLSVAPDMQAHGVGKQLLTAAEDHGRRNNCNRIYMTVISLRGSLLDWYFRRGYQLTGNSKPLQPDPRHGRPVQPLTLLELEKKL